METPETKVCGGVLDSLEKMKPSLDLRHFVFLNLPTIVHDFDRWCRVDSDFERVPLYYPVFFMDEPGKKTNGKKEKSSLKEERIGNLITHGPHLEIWKREKINVSDEYNGMSRVTEILVQTLQFKVKM